MSSQQQGWEPLENDFFAAGDALADQPPEPPELLDDAAAPPALASTTPAEPAPPPPAAAPAEPSPRPPAAEPAEPSPPPIVAAEPAEPSPPPIVAAEPAIPAATEAMPPAEEDWEVVLAMAKRAAAKDPLPPRVEVAALPAVSGILEAPSELAAEPAATDGPEAPREVTATAPPLLVQVEDEPAPAIAASPSQPVVQPAAAEAVAEDEPAPANPVRLTLVVGGRAHADEPTPRQPAPAPVVDEAAAMAGGLLRRGILRRKAAPLFEPVVFAGRRMVYGRVLPALTRTRVRRPWLVLAAVSIVLAVTAGLTMATMGLHSAAPVSIPDIRPPRTTPPAAAIVAPMAAPTATQPLAHQRHHPRRGPAHHRAGRHHPHAP